MLAHGIFSTILSLSRYTKFQFWQDFAGHNERTNSVNRPSPPRVNFCLFWASPSGLPYKDFETCLLGRGFHTLIKNTLFPVSTDIGSHNPPPLGPNVLADTHSPLQSMWDPPIHHPSGPAFLLAHRLVSTPLQGSASSLAY